MIDAKKFLEHVINNISYYEKPSPLMEALVNDAGAKDLLDFYRLIEMCPGDVDSLEVTTSEGQVPLADGYKAFIRNFQAMYSVCEKQINWSDGMLLALRWEDYRAYIRITSHNTWCYSGNIPRAISINPPFPLWVPPSNLASQLPPTPSCSESIVESKEDVEPKESIGLDEDISKDSITDKDIKEVHSISTSLLEISTTVLPSKQDANGVLNLLATLLKGTWNSWKASVISVQQEHLPC
jgi:hypothetical protein